MTLAAPNSSYNRLRTACCSSSSTVSSNPLNSSSPQPIRLATRSNLYRYRHSSFLYCSYRHAPFGNQEASLSWLCHRCPIPVCHLTPVAKALVGSKCPALFCLEATGTMQLFVSGAIAVRSKSLLVVSDTRVDGNRITGSTISTPGHAATSSSTPVDCGCVNCACKSQRSVLFELNVEHIGHAVKTKPNMPEE